MFLPISKAFDRHTLLPSRRIIRARRRWFFLVGGTLGILYGNYWLGGLSAPVNAEGKKEYLRPGYTTSLTPTSESESELPKAVHRSSLLEMPLQGDNGRTNSTEDDRHPSKDMASSLPSSLGLAPISNDMKVEKTEADSSGFGTFSLPRLAVATLGGVNALGNYLLLLSGSSSTSFPSFSSSFYSLDPLNIGEYNNGVERNVMIAYRGFSVSQPYEAFIRRNTFIKVLLEKLLDFLEILSGISVGNIRTVYLRNVGMEIFQLPKQLDLFGLGEFWKLLKSFPDYVSGIYKDEELNGFEEIQRELPEGGNREYESRSNEEPNIQWGRQKVWKHLNSTQPVSRELKSLTIPNDPYYPTQWAHVDTGNNWWGVDTPLAWREWTGNENKDDEKKLIVALIDSGADYTHPDLWENIWVNKKEICNNGIDDDNNGLIDDCYGWDFFNGDNDPMDDNGHGTASAGIIAGTANNGEGIAGVCWGSCRLMVLKALNHQIKGTVIGFVRALDYAIGHGARISNNSYGGRGSSFAGLEEAVKRAKQAGMIFVAAAGNYKGNNDNDHNPVYPASYKFDNVISVAAITRTGDLAEFSSFGKTSVDLAAPGQDIFSTGLGGVYKSVDGTSFAVPFVAGAIALMWSRDPSLHYKALVYRIKTFTKYNEKLKDLLRSGGVLNIYAAMTEADSVEAVKESTLLTDAVRKCSSQANLCGGNSICTDETHGPVCACIHGFTRVGNSCEDVNECLYEPCGPAADCKNSIGSFECVCRSGFMQVGESCKDINECSQEPSPCPLHAMCLNFVGNYDCVCPPSYAWNAEPMPNTKCLSIRSPSSGPCVRNGGCGINSLCQSTGSWWFPEKQCVCFPGYIRHATLNECVRPAVMEQQYTHYIFTIQAAQRPLSQSVGGGVVGGGTQMQS